MVRYHLYLFDELHDRNSFVNRMRLASSYYSLKEDDPAVGTVNSGFSYNEDGDRLVVDDTVLDIPISISADIVCYYYESMNRKPRVCYVDKDSINLVNKLDKNISFPKYWIFSPGGRNSVVIQEDVLGIFDETFDYTFE